MNICAKCIKKCLKSVQNNQNVNELFVYIHFKFDI